MLSNNEENQETKKGITFTKTYYHDDKNFLSSI